MSPIQHLIWGYVSPFHHIKRGVHVTHTPQQTGVCVTLTPHQTRVQIVASICEIVRLHSAVSNAAMCDVGYAELMTWTSTQCIACV